MKKELKNHIARTTVLNLATEYGFQKGAVINVVDLFSLLQKAPPLVNIKKIKHNLIKYLGESSVKQGAFLVCALSCFRDEPGDLSTKDCSHGLIAPFARRNYYAEAVKRMKQLAKRLRQDFNLAKTSMRIFCNSKIAEKSIAAAAGLGFYGKNGLIITRDLGSLFVIALLYIPLDIEHTKYISPIKTPGANCSHCNACVQACPTRAISCSGIVDPNRCLQTYAKQMIILDDDIKKLWDFRIYGCQDCQNVCPYNSQLGQQTHTEYGEIGPSIALSSILQMQFNELKSFLKKTTLGLSWLKTELIIRNALLAAGNRKDNSLKSLIKPFTQHSNPVIQDAARWALSMINKN